MNRLKLKDWIINTLIIVVIVGGGAAIKFLPRTVPYSQCSEVYKRYCEVEGIRATYLKDYRLNDTVTVGVTLLEAETDSGWVQMLQKFKAPNDMVELEKSGQKRIKVWTRLAPKGHPEERIDGGAQGENTEEWKFDVVTISFEQRAVGIFDVNSMEEYLAMFDYNYSDD